MRRDFLYHLCMSSEAGILSFEEARRTVEEHARAIAPGPVETVSLLDGAGRVLAEALVADRDFPPFPRATRDGFALRASDLYSIPAKMRVVAEIRAGSGEPAIEIHKGECARIMTGAAVPPGADAIVMVEYTAEHGEVVEIARGVSLGENIVPAGAEARRGDMLLESGTRLTEAGIAVAAAIGAAQLRVFSRPRIAVLATGDEVVGVATLPLPNQIRNSNSYSLAAQIVGAGAQPVLLPIAPDERVRLRELIEEGLRSDLLLLAGGVSAGKYDLVEQVLSELGAQFFFTGARIQPGKPIVFGRVSDRYFFGLPGNPVSTMVTFELFARPMIESLSGMRPAGLMFLHARLKSDVKVKPGLKRFLPAVLSGEFEDTQVELARWQGSGDIAATARANCYIVIPPDREKISSGEWVPVLER